jgi:hypothetical protein
LQANSLIGDYHPPNKRFQIIDIGNFLHQDVKSQMHRKDSTRFKIAFHNNKLPDARTLLDGRVAELLFWAEENGFDQTDVKAALRRRVEAESNHDGDRTMARPAVAKIVGELKSPPEILGNAIPQQSKIKGTTMAPRRTKNSQTTPSSKSKTGGKLSSLKSKKAQRDTGLGASTKNMIHDFVNQVSKIYVI